MHVQCVRLSIGADLRVKVFSPTSETAHSFAGWAGLRESLDGLPAITASPLFRCDDNVFLCEHGLPSRLAQFTFAEGVGTARTRNHRRDTSIRQIVGDSLSLSETVELFKGLPFTFGDFHVKTATFMAPAGTIDFTASVSKTSAVLVVFHSVLLPRNQRGLTVSIVDNSLHFVKNFSRFVLKWLATHVYNSPKKGIN
jgi:hypothetical protein